MLRSATIRHVHAHRHPLARSFRLLSLWSFKLPFRKSLARRGPGAFGFGAMAPSRCTWAAERLTRANGGVAEAPRYAACSCWCQICSGSVENALYKTSSDTSLSSRTGFTVRPSHALLPCAHSLGEATERLCISSNNSVREKESFRSSCKKNTFESEFPYRSFENLMHKHYLLSPHPSYCSLRSPKAYRLLSDFGRTCFF